MEKRPISTSGGSCKGAGRKQNNDRYVIELIDKENILLAVCDGMGGHPAGDIAAEDIVECLQDHEEGIAHPSAFLGQAVANAESVIMERVEKKPDLTGMGATVTAVIIHKEMICWIHIGDSRLYLLRNGALRQITRDHSFLQDFIDEGKLTPQEAAVNPMAHVLDQCVGCADAGPDSGSFALVAGDVILLCTDGVYRSLGEEAIKRTLSPAQEATDQVDSLLDKTLQAGTRDDATVVVAVFK